MFNMFIWTQVVLSSWTCVTGEAFLASHGLVVPYMRVSVVGDGIALLSDHIPKEASGEVDLDRSV